MELVVAIAVAAVVGLLAWPTMRAAITKTKMTRTMNNAREFYLAGFHMATDGAAKPDANFAWPGDYPSSSLADYCGKLVQNHYLKATELERILSAPGANCTVTSVDGAASKVTLAGNSALKIYKVKGADPSNTIFSASANYVYDTPLRQAAIPFGDAGFVVVRKSGDAGLYRPAQATPAGFDDNAGRFQAEMGALPGAEKGSVTPGDGATVLAPAL